MLEGSKSYGEQKRENDGDFVSVIGEQFAALNRLGIIKQKQ